MAEEKRTLEKSFARLEEITKALEDPDTTLENSFALYQEGCGLLKEAGEKIDLVEKQVKVLDEGGGLSGFQ